MVAKPRHPTQKPPQGAWDPKSPYYELQCKAHREKKVYRHSDGTVILPNTSMIHMAELDRFLDKRTDMQRLLAEFSASQAEQGFDSIEDFYDFGPPDDQWDDIEPPGQMFDEMPPAYGFEEDLAARAFYSQQTGAGRPAQDPEEGDASPSERSENPAPEPDGAGT